MGLCSALRTFYYLVVGRFVWYKNIIMFECYFLNSCGFSFFAFLTMPSKMNVFLVLRYMNPIPAARIAPSVSTIKSPIVSTSPDFCIFSANNCSIENSKISQMAPIAIANENEKIAIASGLALTSLREYIRYRIVKPMKPKTIAEPAWSRVSHHGNML